ncbi:MAG: MarR family transcriptional regulator [Balneolaceae bacterium]|nr:MarR family transcriptional regulator [Balneolaceae bacterium]MBO6545537.1 MarR family transcriptional regulator [Balneolaceae bacterium]MBO6646933.1 MarR family transcriptional regulator [Balneolaceae bacterium]
MPTHFKGSKKEIESLNTFIKMTRATESINHRLSTYLAESCERLTVSQFGILEALLHLGPSNQKELGRKILKTGGNITLVIDNLEKRNYVKRETDPNDRRASIVSLTTEGKDFISGYFPAHVEKIVEEFSSLTSEELKELGRLCKKVGMKENN